MSIDDSSVGSRRRNQIVSRLPFYYGWIILAVGSLGVLASIPGQTMGVSVFTDHFIQNLQLSRVSISTAYMVGTLASSLLIPRAGALYDIYGARIAASIAAVALAGFLLILAYSPIITTAISTNTGISPTFSALLIVVIGFFGIRFFGQGVLTIVSRGMVARWFSSRRGFVVGIMGLITAFGFSYAPQPLQSLIQMYDWNGALIVIAWILVVLFLPVVLLFFRSSPEVCGMVVEEGMTPNLGNPRTHAQDAAKELTVREARKRPEYWVMLGMIGFWSLYNTAFTFHVVSIFDQVGFSASEAVSIFLPMSVVSMATRFFGSYLSDRISLRWMYGAFAVAMIFASVSLAWILYPWARYMAMVFFGMGTGMLGMLQIVSWPKLYGRRHLGAISGFAMSMAVAGSAVGPWLFSLAFSMTGGYQVAGFGGVVASMLLLILVIRVRFYR